MCCLLQKHASPPAQNKWAVSDVFTSNCSSVCGESYGLSRQLRPVHLRDRRAGLLGDMMRESAGCTGWWQHKRGRNEDAWKDLSVRESEKCRVQTENKRGISLIKCIDGLLEHYTFFLVDYFSFLTSWLHARGLKKEKERSLRHLIELWRQTVVSPVCSIWLMIILTKFWIDLIRPFKVLCQ